MAISQDRYVSIKSTNIGTSEVSDRNLSGLVFTQGKGWIFPTDDFGNYDVTGTVKPMEADKIVECYSIAQVGKYFAVSSDEYKAAVRYFSYRSRSGTSPMKLSFARVKVSEGTNLLLYKVKNEDKVETSGEFSFTVEVDKDVFAGIVDYKTESLEFKYSDGHWKHKGENVRIGNYGITIVGVPVEGNTLTVKYTQAVYAWYNNEKEVVSPTIEEPVNALIRVNLDTNNFGSYNYIDDYTCKQMKAVATTNAALNYKYLNSMVALSGANSAADGQTTSSVKPLSLARYYGKINGSILTYGNDKFSAMLPMAILAATNYDGVNTATYFMFKQLDGEIATVSDDTTADEFDDLYVNYYGLVQMNGQRKAFYQRGVNLDGENTAVYCNEIWLKSRIATDILELMLSVEKIPADEDGELMIDGIVTAAAIKGITNGVIEKNKELTSAQKVKIYQLTNNPEADFVVQEAGYYSTTKIQERSERPGEYEAVYMLIYSKGDAISMVQGTHILV